MCIFDPHGNREIARHDLTRTGGTWATTIPGLTEGARYGFRAEGPWAPEAGHRFDPQKILVDPYAVEIDRPFAFYPELCLPPHAALDTHVLVPKAVVRALPPPVDRPMPAKPGFIYELSVRAFSKLHPSVPEHLRGTLAALKTPALLEHMKRIGIDTIELMPLAAWIDERHLSRLGLTNAWGYNPIAMMAPDPRLVPGGMAEVIDTLRVLHDNGFRVLLDVVLNHTGEGEDSGPILSLRGLDNAAYYRHATDDPGRMINDTGCGNTLALDRPETVRWSLDILRHWVRLGFDGFRFDLAPVMGRLATGFRPDAPLLAAMAADPVLSKVTLIAEPWDVGPGGYQLGAFGAPWQEWNDHYRDDVRRFWRGDAGAASGLATRLAGSSDIFLRSGRPPSASVNFIAAHDGFPLADLAAYAGKHNEANGEENRDGTNDNLSWNNGAEGATADETIRAARKRDVRALIATLLLSRGTPMLTAGDEFGRTQGGNNNAYAQDNTTTWLDWVRADDTLAAMTGTLAHLRKQHPALSADRFLTGRPSVNGALADATWLRTDGTPMRDADWASADVLGLLLVEGSNSLCLYLNRSKYDFFVDLPRLPGSWHVAFSTTRAKGPAEPLPGGRLTLDARSVALCVRR